MGQRVDAALRGGVGLGAGLALQVACRAEVDDAAVAAVAVLLAVEGQPTRGDEGRAQVGGQNAVELLDRELGEGFEEADPDVVDQDVDVALCGEELLHACFEALGVGDVHLAEAGAGFGCGLGAEDGIDVAEDHLSPCRAKASTIPFPIPWAPPVTNTRLFMVFGFFHKDSAGRSPEQNTVANFSVNEPWSTVGRGGSFGVLRGCWIWNMNTARKIILPGRITWMSLDL